MNTLKLQGVTKQNNMQKDDKMLHSTAVQQLTVGHCEQDRKEWDECCVKLIIPENGLHSESGMG